MEWCLVKKVTEDLPQSGTYKDWKEKLAYEGNNQCVYCAIHEARFGGERNFHVEHFRPKSKFPELENNFYNLFYSCSICNSFKGNDWPDEPCNKYSRTAYIDPSQHDYNKIFYIKDNRVLSEYVSSNYMIERLYLNRPQLILERRIRHCDLLAESINQNIQSIIKIYEDLEDDRLKANLSPYLLELTNLLSRTLSLVSGLHKAKPYYKRDVTR